MATIREVSKLAGVSVATVSRAFSDRDKVAKPTYEKIIAAAEKLDYKPNYLSQIFRANKTRTIVVMVPDLSNAFFSHVLSGIEKIATANQYSILLADTKDDIAIERACVEMVQTRRADGVIQLGATSAEQLLGDKPTAIPFVHAIENPQITRSPTVCIDNIASSTAIVDYLISLGHQNIGVIGGPKESAITKNRHAGFQKSLEKAGLEPCETLIEYTDFSLDGGAQAAAPLVRRRPDISAIFCMSDEIAIGAIKALKELGIYAPDDMSIVGFDNIEHGKYCYPSLTTVTQPAERIGKIATELFCALAEGIEPTETRHILPTQLIIRDSAKQCCKAF